MTYEYATYFKLLLLCGYKDELQQYIDNALVEQDPLSDIILDLCTVGADDNKLLSVLNEYLSQIKESDIDFDNTVFDLVMSFLKRKYTDEAMPITYVTELMYKLAVYSERYLDEPWQTMYMMDDLLCGVKEGYFDEADYHQKFEAFINDKACFSDYPTTLPKETLIKRILKRIKGIR